MSGESRTTPEAAVASLSRALAERRWADAVACLDPRSVQEFHRSQLESLPRRSPPHPQLTPEVLMRHDPEMPRAVAEYTVRQHLRHQQERLTDPDREFTGVTSWAEIATLPPDELLSRWLDAQDPVHELRRHRMRRSLPPPPDDFLPPRRQFIPLGHVRETERVAHVVCRDHFAEPEHEDSPDASGASTAVRHAGPLHVVTTRRDDDGNWFVVFDYALLAGGAVWVYDEEPLSDDAPGKDHGPDTAA